MPQEFNIERKPDGSYMFSQYHGGTRESLPDFPSVLDRMIMTYHECERSYDLWVTPAVCVGLPEGEKKVVRKVQGLLLRQGNLEQQVNSRR